jgi:hypothetical protein
MANARHSADTKVDDVKMMQLMRLLDDDSATKGSVCVRTLFATYNSLDEVRSLHTLTACKRFPS